MDISNGLKQSRILSGLKQGEFANRAGITQTYVSLIESGKKIPSVEVIDAYAKITKQPLAIILWRSIIEKDVQQSKRKAFKELKPLIDNLIEQIFNQTK